MDVTISNGIITLLSSDRFAGGFGSLVLMKSVRLKEFLDKFDHGRGLQSACAFDNLGEAYNPTEDGSGPDYYTGGLSSILLERTVTANRLHSRTQMAYWNPVDGVVTSNHILTKDVVVGHPASPHVIEYRVKFHNPEEHQYGQFEALTAYQPADFSCVYFWDKGTGLVVRTTAMKEYWGIPTIMSTADGT
jgi:hypothetical protein